MADAQLIVCGWDEVSIWDDICSDNDVSVHRVWNWRAKDCQDLPNEFRTLFNTTDECKPFDKGKRLLITSSGGAVALVNRETNEVIFYARAANAHSADLLPNNRLVVAASHSPNGLGDRLILFDISRPAEGLFSTELPWAHGTVWDDDRQLLWALGYTEVRAYALGHWDSPTPELRHVKTIPLSEPCGHDLSVVPAGPFLSVTTHHHCWLLNRDTGAIKPHPQLGDMSHVKSVSYHPDTHRVAYIQASGDCWWSESVHFYHPDATIRVPGEHFYKARWNV